MVVHQKIEAQTFADKLRASYQTPAYLDQRFALMDAFERASFRGPMIGPVDTRPAVEKIASAMVHSGQPVAVIVERAQ